MTPSNLAADIQNYPFPLAKRWEYFSNPEIKGFQKSTWLRHFTSDVAQYMSLILLAEKNLSQKSNFPVRGGFSCWSTTLAEETSGPLAKIVQGICADLSNKKVSTPAGEVSLWQFVSDFQNQPQIYISENLATEIFQQILQSLQPLCSWELIYHQENLPTPKYIKMSGSSQALQSGTKFSFQKEGASNLFLHNQGQVVPLFPYAFASGHEVNSLEIFLWQHGDIATQQVYYNSCFNSLTCSTQQFTSFLPKKAQHKKPKKYSELIQALGNELEQQILRRASNARYVQMTYVLPDIANSEIKNFCQEKSSIFLLLQGKAGVGKSSILLQVAQAAQAEGNGAFLFDGTDFDASSVDPSQHGLNATWEEIFQTLSKEGKKCIWFVDNIVNQQQVSNLVAFAQRFPDSNLKVVMVPRVNSEILQNVLGKHKNSLYQPVFQSCSELPAIVVSSLCAGERNTLNQWYKNIPSHSIQQQKGELPKKLQDKLDTPLWFRFLYDHSKSKTVSESLSRTDILESFLEANIGESPKLASTITEVLPAFQNSSGISQAMWGNFTFANAYPQHSQSVVKQIRKADDTSLLTFSFNTLRGFLLAESSIQNPDDFEIGTNQSQDSFFNEEAILWRTLLQKQSFDDQGFTDWLLENLSSPSTIAGAISILDQESYDCEEKRNLWKPFVINLFFRLGKAGKDGVDTLLALLELLVNKGETYSELEKFLSTQLNVLAPEQLVKMYMAQVHKAQQAKDLEAISHTTSTLWEVAQNLPEAYSFASQIAKILLQNKVYEQSIAMANKAIELAGDDLKRKLDASSILARTYQEQQNFEQAEKTYEGMLIICDELQDTNAATQILRDMAPILGRNNLMSAVDYYENSLAISKDSRDDSLEQIAILYEKGNIYRQNNQTEQVIELYQTALSLAQSLPSYYWVAKLKCDLGKLWEEEGEEEKTLVHYEESREVTESLGFFDLQGLVHRNLAGYFEDQGEDSKAAEHMNASVNAFQTSGLENEQAESYSALGMLYDASDELEKALQCYQASSEIFKRQSNNLGLGSSYKNMGVLFSRQKNNDKAMEYFEKAKSLFQGLGLQQEISGVDYWINRLGN